MFILGGDVEFEFVDSLDFFFEGIMFSVWLFKKSWKKIFNFLGGEKIFSLLVLVFVFYYYKFIFFYFMDEIDVVFDFKNVFIVVFYIYE